ncbi:MAG: O-antigen ligase family protein [Bacteroidota bacterium]|nr:O-antigen ligase family protein [Bacteroidota bacterium]
MAAYIIIIFALLLLIYNPYKACILLYSLVIANINIETGIDGFNFRSLFTIAVIIRLIGMSLINKDLLLRLISNKYIISIFLIRFYFFLTTSLNGLYSFENLKWILLDYLLILITFCLFDKNKSINIIISILIAGLICFTDLVYTYLFFDGFPVRRLISAVLGENIATNHNFFGYICGVSLIIVLQFWELFRKQKFYYYALLILAIIYITGIIISTSRSALLGILVIFVFFVLNSSANKTFLKSFFKIGISILIILPFVSSIFISRLDDNIITKLKNRIIDEPVAMYEKHTGGNYNEEDLDSGEWRKESSGNAIENYEKLNLIEKFIGIGRGGYLKRNLGDGLSTHNGYLLILMEYGALGLIFYVTFLIFLVISAFKYRFYAPYYLILVYILFYSLPQNEELIGTLMTIIIISNIYVICQFKSKQPNYYISNT